MCVYYLSVICDREGNLLVLIPQLFKHVMCVYFVACTDREDAELDAVPMSSLV